MPQPNEKGHDHSSHTSKSCTRRLLITVHGIRTFGGWQERLEGMIGDEVGANSVQVLNYKYGYFSVAAFIIPFFRWLVVRRFRKDFIAWCRREKWSRIDIVGHSFGTHVLAWALHSIPEDERPKIQTIILAGSVLRGSFPWRDLQGSCVDRVVNDCGSRDKVLIWNSLLVLFTGMAGRAGFSGATHKEFRNRFFEFGHSGYFVDEYGKPDNKWMHDYWRPILTTEKMIKPYDERSPPTVLDGVIQTLANNAEPVKLTIYLLPPVVAGIWIWGLYIGEIQAKKEAQSHAEVAETRRMEIEERSIAQLKQLATLRAEQSTARSNASEGADALIVALEGYRTLKDAPELSGHTVYSAELETAIHQAWPSNSLLHVLDGHLSEVLHVEFDSFGKRILSTSADNTAIIWNSTTGEKLHTLVAHTDEVVSGRFNSNGTLVATVSRDATARVWRVDDGTLVATLRGHKKTLTFVEWHPNNDILVTASRDNSVRVWDTDQWNLRLSLPHSSDVVVADLHPNGHRIATGTWDGDVHEWDLTNGDLQYSKSVAGIKVTDVSYSHDGTRIAASARLTAWLWDSLSPENYSSYRFHQKESDTALQEVKVVDFSPDGLSLLTGNGDGFARVIDSESGKLKYSTEKHTGKITTALYNPQGDMFLTASEDGTVNLWESSTGSLLRKFRGHLGSITSAAFSPMGARIVTGSEDGSIRIWTVRSDRPFYLAEEHEAPIRCIEFSPDERTFATTHTDGVARIWDTRSMKPTFEIEIPDSYYSCAYYSPNGRSIIAYSKTAVRVWDVANGKPRAPAIPGNFVMRPVSSPDGGYFAVGTDFTMWIIDANTGVSVAQLEVEMEGGFVGDAGLAPLATFSADGRMFITNGRTRGSISVLNLDDSKIKILNNSNGWISQAMLASKDSLLVTTTRGQDAGEGKGSIDVWNPKSGKHLKEYRGIDASINAKGSRIFIISEQGDLQSWNLVTGEQIYSVRDGDASLYHTTVSPNGEQIATLGSDGRARIWDTGSGELRFKFHGGWAVDGIEYLGKGNNVLIFDNYHRSTGNVVQIWSGISGKKLMEFDRPETQTGGAYAWSSSSGKYVIAAYSNFNSAWNPSTYRIHRTFPSFESAISYSEGGAPSCPNSSEIESLHLEAIKSWCKTNQIWPFRPARYIVSAREMLENERDARARKEFDKALELDPSVRPLIDNIWAVELVKRGNEALEAGDEEVAEKQFETALKMSSDVSVEIRRAKVGRLLKLGWSARVDNNSKEALTYFRQAITLDPKASEAYVGRASIQWDIGENSAAANDFKKAISLDSESELAFRFSNAFWFDQMDYETAYNHALRAINLGSVSENNAERGWLSLIAMGTLHDAEQFWSKTTLGKPSASAFEKGVPYSYEWRKLGAERAIMIDVNARLWLAQNYTGKVDPQEHRRDLRSLAYAISDTYRSGQIISQSDILACDRLAAHTNDPFRTAAEGISFKEIDAEKATAACSKAIQVGLNSKVNRRTLGRFYYQRSRAWSRKDAFKEMRLDLEEATKLGYPMAYDTLAYYTWRGDGGLEKDKELASRYWMESVNRVVHCCALASVDAIDKGEFRQRADADQTVKALLKWAAKLGSSEAHKLLAHRAMDVNPEVALQHQFIHNKLERSMGQEPETFAPGSISEEERKKASEAASKWNPMPFTATPSILLH